MRHDDVDYDDDQEEDEESAEELPKRKSAMKDEKENLKQFLTHGTALDNMLEGGGGSKSDKGLDDKLDKLRARLQGKAVVPGHSGKKPGGILARRATENAGKHREKRRKRRSSGSRVLNGFQKAIEKKRKKKMSDSSDSYDESYSDDVEGVEPGGGWTHRKKYFKKIAEESPGKLMMQSLEAMEEHLGTRFGEAGSAEEKLSRVVTRYLLSVIVPAIGAKASKATMRELRTLGLATDLLLKGKVTQQEM